MQFSFQNVSDTKKCPVSMRQENQGRFIILSTDCFDGNCPMPLHGHLATNDASNAPFLQQKIDQVRERQCHKQSLSAKLH